MSATITNGTGRGYGKHSRTFWALLYLLIGAIVYAIIYILFTRMLSGGGTPTY